MTDKEIIKAFELCLKCEDFTGCRECPAINNGHNTIQKCRLALFNNALELITRQQAELKNLKVKNRSLRSAANSLKMHYEEAQAEIERLKENLNIELDNFASEYDNKIKAEAYKECLAKVKNYIKTHCNPYGKPDFDYDTSIKILNFIDKLAKEMVGDDNA